MQAERDVPECKMFIDVQSGGCQLSRALASNSVDGRPYLICELNLLQLSFEIMLTLELTQLVKYVMVVMYR